MVKPFGIRVILLLLIFSLTACASGTTFAEEATEVKEPVQTVEPAHQLLTAETLAPGQHSYSYIASTGEEVVLLLYLPEGYDSQEDWPLIVFLHGHGSYGTNTDLIIEQGGLPAFLLDDPDFEFIVVSPQLPDGRWGKYYVLIEELLPYIGEMVSVDQDRLMLTGLSMGAFGVWQYSLEYPDRFAAIVPVAGLAKSSSDDPVPEDICTLKDAGIWVFHGGEDKTPPPEVAQALVDALESCGAEVKFTLYPDADHRETWLLAYADPALYDWLAEQSK